jgi:hypothetical protein
VPAFYVLLARDHSVLQKEETIERETGLVT